MFIIIFPTENAIAAVPAAVAVPVAAIAATAQTRKPTLKKRHLIKKIVLKKHY